MNEVNQSISIIGNEEVGVFERCRVERTLGIVGYINLCGIEEQLVANDCRFSDSSFS